MPGVGTPDEQHKSRLRLSQEPQVTQAGVCNPEHLVWLACLVWVVRSRQEVTASKLREKQDLIMEFPVLYYKDCSFIISSINTYIKNLPNVSSQGDRFVVEFLSLLLFSWNF